MINILSNFCEEPTGYQVMGFLGVMITIIKICVPIILVVIGSIDLAKCVMQNKDEEVKKNISKLIKKVICAVIIFFIPSLISLVFSFVGENVSATKCFNCLLDYPTECIEIGKNLKSGSSNDTLCSQYNGKKDLCKSPCEYVGNYCQKIDN